MINTARVARIYIACFLAIVVVFNVWAATPAAAELEFEGLWQFWHPYMVPFVALLVVPFSLGYARRVIAGFDGGSIVADGLWWINIALLSWSVLGAAVYGGYLTCAEWPLWQCDNPLGTVPAPSLADVGSGLLFFSAFAMGLSKLSRLVGVTRATMMRAWWLFLVLLVINLWIATPLGVARTVPSWDWSDAQTYVALFYVVANVVVSAWAIIIARHSKAAAGGMFAPLVYTVLVAAVVSMVNNYLFTGVSSDLASDLSITLFGVMVIALMYAYTIAGSIIERMQAATADA